MTLETIVSVYGWNDYMDMNTGYIYQLSKAESQGNGTLKVPVIVDGQLYGYATMKGER